MNFKVGDKIKAIRDCVGGSYRYGDVFTVTGIRDDYDVVYFNLKNNRLWYGSKADFELVQSSQDDSKWIRHSTFGDAMDAMQKEIANAFTTNTNPAYIQETSCSHSWVEYTGFSLAYEFCGKCDKKRNVKKA